MLVVRLLLIIPTIEHPLQKSPIYFYEAFTLAGRCWTLLSIREQIWISWLDQVKMGSRAMSKDKTRYRSKHSIETHKRGCSMLFWRFYLSYHWSPLVPHCQVHERFHDPCLH